MGAKKWGITGTTLIIDGQTGRIGSAQHNDSEDNTVKFSSEIWRHFDHEDEEAKCSLCKEVVGNSIEDMKNHLEEHHSTLLDEIIAKAQKGLNGDSDEDNAMDNDNVYTEVVYLEDELNKNSPQKKRKREEKPKINIKSRVKNERKFSESSYESPKEQATETTGELEIFINYVRSLLKKVPKEAAPKLHLDIINLIMSAQCNQPQTSVHIESVNLNADSNLASVLDKSFILTPNGQPSMSCGNNQRVITLPLQNLLSQSNDKVIAVPIPQMYSVSSPNTSNTDSNTTATSIMKSAPVASSSQSLPNLTN